MNLGHFLGCIDAAHRNCCSNVSPYEVQHQFPRERRNSGENRLSPSSGLAKIGRQWRDHHRYTPIRAGGKGMTNRYLLGAGVALAVALGGVQAHAQFAQSAWWPTGTPWAWYIGPEGGWTSLTSQSESTSSVHFNGPNGGTFSTPGFNATPNTDSGFNVGGRGGVQWGPWRLEEEYSYRRNSLSNNNSFNILGPFGNTFTTTGGRTQGQVHSNAIMTNLIYDFTLGWPVTPHIGAGVGAVDVITSASINRATLANPIGPPIVP